MSVKRIAIGMAAVIGFFTLLALMPFTIIETGSVGVVQHFGAYEGKILSPGFHLLMPIRDDVTEINVQVQTFPVSSDLAYTKENQTVALKSTLQYSVNAQEVGALFSEIGMDFETKIIKPLVEERLKNAVAQYNANDLARSRAAISSDVEVSLREVLSKSHITVVDFVYQNEDFNDDYEAAIAAKQIEEQNALKAKNVTAQEEENKKQEILKAQAMAEKTRLEVEALKIGGDEYVRKLNAEAAKIEAEAQLEYARHWTGNVPQSITILGGENGTSPVIPFIPLK